MVKRPNSIGHLQSKNCQVSRPISRKLQKHNFPCTLRLGLSDSLIFRLKYSVCLLLNCPANLYSPFACF